LGTNNGLRLRENLYSYSRSLGLESIKVSVGDIESSLCAAGVVVVVLENRRA
jgi:hypothetical protein